MSSIELKNVTVIYENREEKTIALNDISVQFLDKKVNVIVGFSGSGKTTLLKVIAGTILYNGELYFDSEEVSGVRTKFRNVSYVSQEFVLYPHLTIYDNIAFPLKILKMERNEIDKRVKEIAKELDIYHCLSRKPKHISVGQQQRVALARALVKEPNVLLMDEPLSNLDQTSRNNVKLLLKKTLDRLNVTTIYVTHDFLDAMSLADQLYVINDGKLILSGNPLDVYNSEVEEIKYLKESVELHEF